MKDRPRQLVRQDGKRFPFAVNFGQLLHQLLGWRIVADEQERRLGECPFQMGITDLGSAGPFLLPG